MRTYKVTGLMMLGVFLGGMALAPISSYDIVLASAKDNIDGGDRRTEDSAVQEFKFALPEVNPKSLNELDHHRWNNKTVRDKKGEFLGTIEKVMVDRKGGKESYAMLKLSDDMPTVPIPLNAIKEDESGLVLNASKEQLKRRALNLRDQK
jgi:hypothetical protein